MGLDDGWLTGDAPLFTGRAALCKHKRGKILNGCYYGTIFHKSGPSSKIIKLLFQTYDLKCVHFSSETKLYFLTCQTHDVCVQ